ncbi:hypothetical protein NMY22_g797 [Coprinellus aureogranulatus]|nr:hypothetical protein NMY22_g797 [Coprinellus aureogranulatus]
MLVLNNRLSVLLTVLILSSALLSPTDAAAIRMRQDASDSPTTTTLADASLAFQKATSQLGKKATKNAARLPRTAGLRTITELTEELTRAGYDPSRIEERAKMLAKIQGAKRRREDDEDDDDVDMDSAGDDSGDEDMEVDGAQKAAKRAKDDDWTRYNEKAVVESEGAAQVRSAAAECYGQGWRGRSCHQDKATKTSLRWKTQGRKDGQTIIDFGIVLVSSCMHTYTLLFAAVFYHCPLWLFFAPIVYFYAPFLEFQSTD